MTAQLWLPDDLIYCWSSSVFTLGDNGAAGTPTLNPYHIPTPQGPR